MSAKSWFKMEFLSMIAATGLFGTLGYEPNSYGEWQEQPNCAEPPLGLEGAQTTGTTARTRTITRSPVRYSA